MIAYELLPRLKQLTLVGQDEDGELEFFGTEAKWNRVQLEEQVLCMMT